MRCGREEGGDAAKTIFSACWGIRSASVLVALSMLKIVDSFIGQFLTTPLEQIIVDHFGDSALRR